jgi:uncharacterized protein (TIRG00374 family)
MQTQKKPFHVNTIFLVLILGLAAFIAYIYFFINPTELLTTLSKTNLVIYTGAFLSYCAYTLFSSLVWHRLLNNLSVQVTKRKAFLFTWVGLFFEATVPQLGWSAEVSKTYLLSKDSKVDAAKIGASVVGQKIFIMTLSTVAMSIGLVLLLLNYTLPLMVTLLIIAILALSILTLGIVYYVSIKPQATKTLLNWAIKIALFFRKSWNPHSFNTKAEELLTRFHNNIVELKANPKALVQPIIYAVVGFIFELSVMSLSFLALGYPVPVDKVLIVFTLTGIVQSVGVALFVPDLVMTVAFSALFIPSSLALSVTLLTRVVNLWFRLVVSYGALQWTGIKLMRNNPPSLS